MYQIILIVHVLIALSLIVLVLIQHGKGADIGASFGSGASNTVFGSQGSRGFLFKLTGGLAISFFVTSLVLSHVVSQAYQAAKQPIISQPAKNTTQDLRLPIENSDTKQ